MPTPPGIRALLIAGMVGAVAMIAVGVAVVVDRSVPYVLEIGASAFVIAVVTTGVGWALKRRHQRLQSRRPRASVPASDDT